MRKRPEGTFRPFLWVLAAIGVAAVAVGLFGAPLGSVLLLGLVLVCPLMMVGMHGSGSHTSRRAGVHKSQTQTAPEPDTYKTWIGREGR